MQNLLRIGYEKILLLGTATFRGDYPADLRLAVQRLISSSISMLIGFSFVDNTLSRKSLGHYIHSDPRSQCASKGYRRLLKAHGIEGSMGRKGDCLESLPHEVLCIA